ncbi:DUF3300 domain-containing protein [Stappia sp. F7233]|uniref:DUF3300 domain-containing protein n=1 Tax=Stappia albiluteola TaxID=2758565 RepID=A0A839AEK1_9HYPH|nr:DUF3300 domain-containing protein [Stappia albiluteola]MBA5777565.1 DUF3300 domain-containing protein [Stappia albiluteola]
MPKSTVWRLILAACIAAPPATLTALPALAQQQSAAADPAATADDSAPPLTEDELEVLVARIALYPDELVAVISAASLYPLQIVEAARFLADYEKDKSLKPKDSWDGSVISLLNYPQIVKMMSDDLEWTQALGNAIVNQQKDVLIAIQQLREEAVAKGIIKTDDKMTVTQDNDNIVIQPVEKETVYVPQYPPEMLYEPNYAPAPITYYPEPYPSYYWPSATFFAAAVTGVIWAAAVDWNDWGVWGGGWRGGNVDIDCNNCFNNNFRGKVNLNDVDWRNVDRSKINFDRDQLKNVDRGTIKNQIKANTDNSFRKKAQDIRRDGPTTRPGGKNRPSDIRASTLEGLKTPQRPNAGQRPAAKPGAGQRPSAGQRQAQRPAAAQRPAGSKKKAATRPAGKKKPAARADNRPKKASGLGHVSHGKKQKISSQRGGRSMGGGHRGGGRPKHGGGGRGGGRRR